MRKTFAGEIMEQLKVLVTGAGALLGMGILRSLRMAHRPLRIFTADPDYQAPGHWLGDCAFTIPLADDPAFLTSLEELVWSEKIEMVFIGTDAELGILSREKQRLEAECGVRVVVSPPEMINTAKDKWLTAKFLEKEGFPFPQTAVVEDREGIHALVKSVGFPLLGKPRRLARSVGVEKITSPEALEALCLRAKDFIIQEFLPDDQGEFTAGCLVTEGQCRACVVLRRDLRDGNTCRAFSDTSGRYEKLLADVAERLKTEGPCNLQFRIRRGEPVIFEVNPRFSGTTPVRAIFGHNEVEAMIDYLMDGKPIAKPQIREGAVLRTMSDIFINQDQLESLKAAGRLLTPKCRGIPFIV
jgi:carbamoyl-phosphate synthase large subunit